MRIAYPLFADAYSRSGILKKIEDKVRFWNSIGVESKIFLISSDQGLKPQYDPEVVHHVLPQGGARDGWIGRKLYSLSKILELRRQLSKFQPDLVYHRIDLWHSAVFRGLVFSVPCVVELNSIVENERSKAGLGASLAAFKERKTMASAAAFVAVSHELASHYADFGKPTVVLANGYPVDRVVQRNPPRNVRPQLALIGTPGQFWQGFDKVVALARIIPEWDFHIVGPSLSDFGVDVPNNLLVHGYFQQDQLDELYARLDFSFGTLALHRKEMNEASPLKVRECLARGIPVIGGYQDTDLDGFPFFLNIGNKESNVIDSVSLIRDFVGMWKDKVVPRSEVLRAIGLEEKERARVEFLRAFVAS